MGQFNEINRPEDRTNTQNKSPTEQVEIVVTTIRRLIQKKRIKQLNFNLSKASLIELRAKNPELFPGLSTANAILDLFGGSFAVLNEKVGIRKVNFTEEDPITLEKTLEKRRKLLLIFQVWFVDNIKRDPSFVISQENLQEFIKTHKEAITKVFVGPVEPMMILRYFRKDSRYMHTQLKQFIKE